MKSNPSKPPLVPAADFSKDLKISSNQVRIIFRCLTVTITAALAARALIAMAKNAKRFTLKRADEQMWDKLLNNWATAIRHVTDCSGVCVLGSRSV